MQLDISKGLLIRSMPCLMIETCYDLNANYALNITGTIFFFPPLKKKKKKKCILKIYSEMINCLTRIVGHNR